jgi:rhodanese-related sulfurtransferase
MRPLLFKSALIVFGSLVAGLLVNAANPFGIKGSDLVFYVTDSSTPEISIEDAFFQLREPAAIFLDIRPNGEYRIDHIPGAVSLYPVAAIRQLQSVSGKEKFRFIAYDFEAGCPATRRAVWEIRRAGFPNVFALRGGFAAWIEKGLPVDEGESR